MARRSNTKERQQRAMNNVGEVLHMNGGAGENSYATNSQLQQTAIANAKFLVQEAILDVWHNIAPDCLAVADLGCSSGPSALTVISEVIEAIGESCHQLSRPCPELHFFLNDLPGNDFNNVFRSLPCFVKKVKEEYGDEMVPPFYVMGAPGSFYTRLFPRESIHFVYSSFSLMWLSQVPILTNDVGVALNKWSIYIPMEPSTLVLSNYLEEFQKDFSTFLKLRAEEIMSGGKMVLTSLLRKNADESDGEHCIHWELLADALRAMIREGVVEEEKLHTFNLPYYAPSMEELTDIIQNEGSFNLEQACTFETSWKALGYNSEGSIYDITAGENLSKCIRSVAEPLIACHFGEAVIDDLFTRYAQNVAKHLLEVDTKFTYYVITLKKRG